MINIINTKQIGDAVKEGFLKANFFLRPQNLKFFKKIIEDSQSSAKEKWVAQQFIENAIISKEKKLPICQDTGQAFVTLEIGQNVQLEGNYFADEVNRGVREAYQNLRKSIVRCQFAKKRKNTEDNTPTILHTKIVKGNSIKIEMIPRGGGGTAKSKLIMEAPFNKFPVDEIVEHIKKIGGGGCPPYTVGICIGGDPANIFRKATSAAYLDLDFKNPNKEAQKYEKLLEEKIRKLNIGAQGLGGKYQVAKVNILEKPSHMANKNVAVVILCVAARKSVCNISSHGTVTWEPLEEHPEKYLPDVNFNLPTKNLELPLDNQKIKNLKIGQILHLNGTIFVGRDIAHIHMKEKWDKGENPPFNIKNQAIYYMGPTPTPQGCVIGSCGPTTSSRMNPYAPTMIEHGLKMIIGKGPMSKEVQEACKKYNAIYCVAIGGTAALYAKKVKSQKIIAYEEEGAEALRKIEVENFPVVVKYGG